MTKCFQCRFWMTRDERHGGECHRHAKQGASWPRTGENDWCGDAAPGDRVPWDTKPKGTYSTHQPTNW